MSIAFLSLAQAATLAYAIVGGVFIAFSDFIMRSLARTSGTGGVEAMQIINREVFRWLFMVLFIGLAPISIGIALYGLNSDKGSHYIHGSNCPFAGIMSLKTMLFAPPFSIPR